MNNNPIGYNDPLGDEIRASRKERRALKKRDDWEQIKSKYKGSLFKKSDRDLRVTSVSSKDLINEYDVTDIYNADTQEEALKGGENCTTCDHLYHTPLTETISKKFSFGNRHHSFLGKGKQNRNYPTINVGKDFTSGLFGKNIYDYLKKHRNNEGFQIKVDFVRIKMEDVNTENPATYTFKLNDEFWASYRAIRGRNYINTNLNVFDKINAEGVWNKLNRHYDGCHGFLIRTTLTITKKVK